MLGKITFICLLFGFIIMMLGYILAASSKVAADNAKTSKPKNVKYISKELRDYKYELYVGYVGTAIFLIGCLLLFIFYKQN